MNWKLKKYISGIIAVIILFTMIFSNLILVNAAEENYDSYIIKQGEANTVTFNVSENGFNAKASKGKDEEYSASCNENVKWGDKIYYDEDCYASVVDSIPDDATSIEVIPSKSSVVVGEEFYADFVIKNNPRFAGYIFMVSYDPDVVLPVSADTETADVKYDYTSDIKKPVFNAEELNDSIQRESGSGSFSSSGIICNSEGKGADAYGDGLMFRVKFKAVGEGKANVCIKNYDYSYGYGEFFLNYMGGNIPVYVQNKIVTVREPIKVTGIEIAEKEVEVLKGNLVNIKANITPEDADDKYIMWRSSNTEIAEVDENGKVKGISEGTAVITATTKDGEYSASCNVNVKLWDKIYYDERCYASVVDSIPNDATSIEVIPSKSSVVVGEEFYADFVIKNNPRFWGYGFTVSYDPDVVLPVSVDTETADVKYDYTSDIKKPAINAEGLNDRIKNLESGSCFGYSDMFSTSNRGKFTDAYGDGLMFRVKFKAVREGKANVCIKDYGGEFLVDELGAHIPVYVQNSIVESKNIVITDIILDKTEEELPIGTFLILDAKLNPENATKENILWGSSDSSVASVCQDGIVLAHKAGNAVITAKTESGEISAQCNIKVTTAPAPMGYKHGDMDGDGKLTANDAAILLRKVLDGKFIMPIENLWKNN